MLSEGVVAARFEIEERVGSGGMASIYRAKDRLTGELVAIKVLRGTAYADRFLREARLLSELKHPAIVRYIDHGSTEQGELFLAMEWLAGEDLAERLKRGALPVDEALALTARVVDALAFAHGRGVVHRDLKPANLFLPGGDVQKTKILDFGIAHIANETWRVTQTGLMLGTPGYMAPEQASGSKAIESRADIFSLGCVLYHCLAGCPPFAGVDLLGMLARLILEEPPRLCERNPNLPPALDALVAQMMAKSPADRPASASALTRAIERIRASAPLDPEAPVSSAPPGRVLTAEEQRLVSVVVIAPRLITPDAPTVPVPLDRLELTRLAAGVQLFGASVTPLADGSLVANLTTRGEPTDQAAQAARCALAMRAELPDREIVVATGRSSPQKRQLFGEVIDRAGAMLRDASAQPSDGPAMQPREASLGPPRVRLDEITAGLLGSQFEIGGDARSLFLLREREPLEAATRTLLGKPTPCVGRERELTTLSAIYAECTSESVARAALVIAPAGIGKSRLRHEFLRRVEDRGEPVEIWSARGDPMSMGSPLALLRQGLERGLGLRVGDPPVVRHKRLRARLSRHIDERKLPRVADFLGELCGAPSLSEESIELRAARQDPLLMGDQMQRAFDEFLTAECAVQPVIIVLEDLHWGDLPTVQWIDAALRSLTERPLMVLALARPEVHDLFPRLFADRSALEIRLSELTPKSSEKLCRQVLGAKARPETVAAIVERAAGNAFYLEEMIRAVAEGRGDKFPDTVLAVAEARLDQLEPDARRVLRAASLFGQVFWTGGVAALLGDKGAVRVDEWLVELGEREVLVRRRGRKFAGEQEYAFRHALVRDAAYAMLTESDRTLGHRLAANWLEQAGETDPVILAEHREKAGEPARAITWYVRAAEQALSGNDFGAVLKRAKRGIECGAVGDALGALFLVQAEAHRWIGNTAEAITCAEEAMQRLTRGSPRWFTALAGLAEARARIGKYAALVPLAEELRRIDPATAKTEPQAAPNSSPGWGPYVITCARVAHQLLLGEGYLADADSLLAAAEAAASRASPKEPAMVVALSRTRAFRALSTGDVGSFLDFMKTYAESGERVGDTRVALMARGHMAYAHIQLGAYEIAELALREVLATAERMGMRGLSAWAQHNLGLALAHQGAFEEAHAVLTPALKLSVAQHHRKLECTCRSYLALLLLRENDLAGAEREARAATLIPGLTSSPRALALGMLARVLLTQGRAEEALPTAEEAMGLLQGPTSAEEGETMIHLAHIEALVANARPDEARAALGRARERLFSRAAKITDPALRVSFLHRVSDNARLLELGRAFLGAPAS
jgi:eukaryotic-like serine/threonine-protein kinase